MSAEDYADPVQLMNHFYQRIVEVKQWIYEGTLSDHVAAQLNLTRSPSDEEVSEVISLRLERWVEQVRLKVSNVFTEQECRQINEALFVMVALADELFIMQIHWSGREHWHNFLLEEKIYQSCFAGERFFSAAAKLLTKRTLDTQERKLAAVYLFALRLGFSGRYRDQPKRLNHVRQELFKRLNSTYHDADLPVCPQAYQHLLSSWQEQRLAPLAGWYKVIALGSLGYLLIGLAVWYGFAGNWT
mgnify:CR=1 FL=1